MYETDIQSKVSMLPESAKQEVLDFIEFLLIKYSSFSKKRSGKGKNHKSEIAGFAEICRVENVFKDIRGKVRYYDAFLFFNPDSNPVNLGSRQGFEALITLIFLIALIFSTHGNQRKSGESAVRKRDYERFSE